MADEDFVRRRIECACLRHFVEHADEITGEQLLVHLSFSASPGESLWLQEHDAWRIYELGRKGWAAWLDRQGQQGALDAWQAGMSPVPPPPNLPGLLLELVLPAVTSLQVLDGRILLLKPPQAGWQDSLKGWCTFIAQPAEWSGFAEFIGREAGLLGAQVFYPHGEGGNLLFFFNENERERIDAAFNQDEQRALRWVASRVLLARYGGFPRSLQPAEAELWMRLMASFGDRLISSSEPFTGWQTWRIDSFKIDTVTEQEGSSNC